VLSELRIPVSDKSPQYPWVSTHRNDENIELRKRSVINNLVPDVVGMSLKDALFLLENNGLHVDVRGRGTVRKQSLLPGNRVSPGDRIELEMSMN
jgi:cell division protein FtsI (penicillin-binding protein 3)